MSDHHTLTPEADDELRARFRAFAVEVQEHTDTEAALQRLPHRSAPNTRLLAIAAVLVLVALIAAALLVDRQPVDTIPPSEQPSTTTGPMRDATRVNGPLTPGGRYFVDLDGDDATPLRVSFEVATEGWLGWTGALKPLPRGVDGYDGYLGLTITTVSNLVSDGCRDHTPLDPPVGPTVDDLAMALSQLEPFTVTSPPTDVTLGGYPGTHLELAVPALPIDHVGNNVNFFTGCVENELYSWISPLNDTAGPGSRTSGLLGHGSDSRGAFNIYQAVGDTEELWILDVEGTRVVIAAFTPAGTPTADIAERDAMFDSIRVEP